MVFYFPLRKVKFMLYYKSCAGRIVAIPADCKSAAHWASLVRVQPGAPRKKIKEFCFAMTLPTHALAGLIIGKITGDFPMALAGSLVVDLDHAISYFRHGILFKPRQLFNAVSDEEDPWGDQRNFLHSIFSWVAVSALLLIINFNFGLVFSIAYFFHLVFDALDSADFFPFFPFKKIVIKGFVKYYSKQEIIFDIGLAIFLIILWKI